MLLIKIVGINIYSFELCGNEYNNSNTIETSMILQKRITASQVRVKMEAFAIIPQLDTHAAARIIILGTTAIVSIIAIVYIVLIYFIIDDVIER